MKLAKFKVESWLNDYEKMAKYDIAQSSISSLTLEELITIDNKTTVEDFFDRIRKYHLNYGWIEGSDEFKDLVAGLYKNLSRENIIQTNATTGANLLVLYSLINEGNHVISMLPSYQQLYDIPLSFKAEVEFFYLNEENNWQFDVKQLKKLIRPNTKMICLNSANNPTGALISKKDLYEIVKLAKEVNAYILVDEVYAPLNNNDDYISIADIYDRGISTSSLSKTYSLPGLRIGWVAASKEIIEILRNNRDYIMICNGVINDELAIHALKNKDKILERNRKIVEENLLILKEWVDSEEKVEVVLPEYISTCFIKLNIDIDDEIFCKKLLEQKGVLLVPGSAFGIKNHARLGYCCKKDVLIKGLSLLSEFLREENW